MKKAVVTGCAGFLGSHLVKSLLYKGYYVHGIDNLQTGDMKNLFTVMNNSNFNFSHHDVTQKYTLVADEFYNAACAASPPKYQANPIHTLRTCIDGVTHALDNALINGAKVLQFSTSEVYGDPTCEEQSEEYWGNVNPIGIRSCYDEGKRVAETIMTDYARTRGSDIRIVRIFNTYGPGMQKDDGRVVTNFINQALRNEDITMYGNGLQTRSFCYVDDLIRGIIATMNSKITTPVNLGNPVPFTMIELAEKIIKKTNSKSKIVYLPLPQDDPRQRKPNISKAQKELKWNPIIDLNDGLDKTIEYFMENV
jgi:UDP-glucuronate decarboxylase